MHAKQALPGMRRRSATAAGPRLSAPCPHSSTQQPARAAAAIPRIRTRRRRCPHGPRRTGNGGGDTHGRRRGRREQARQERHEALVHERPLRGVRVVGRVHQRLDALQRLRGPRRVSGRAEPACSIKGKLCACSTRPSTLVPAATLSKCEARCGRRVTLQHTSLGDYLQCVGAVQLQPTSANSPSSTLSHCSVPLK